MSEHCIGQGGVGVLHQLGSPRHFGAVQCGEADQLPPVRSDQIGAVQQGFANAPFRGSNQFAHAQIICCGAAIGLGADHHVAFLDPQRAHRLGAVGHDAQRLASADDRLPHRQPLAGWHMDLVSTFTRVAHAEQTG